MKPRWTAAEDRKLLAMWGERSRRAVCSALKGRSWEAIIQRVRRLKLRVGTEAMQGFETVRSAETRTGYSRHALLRILADHGVPLVPHRTSWAGTHWIFVEVAAVDAAIEAEFACVETVRCGARRHGLDAWVLYGWLREAGVLPPTTPGRRQHHRLAPEVIDRVVAARGWRAGSESILTAASRVGMSPDALRYLLASAGVLKPRGRGVRTCLDPKEVDRVVAAECGDERKAA